MAITTVISNPMRALQAENQRLRAENEALRRQLTAGRRLDEQPRALLPAATTGLDEAAARAAARALPSSAARRPMIHLVAAASVAPRTGASDDAQRPTVRVIAADELPSALRSASREEAPAGASVRPREAIAAGVPRAAATEAPLASVPRANRDELAALDDAALRFRLLELD
jgi:hypothetical protein